MINFYTPSTNQLYEFEDNGYDLIANGTVPIDSIAISDELLVTLRNGLSAGQTISLDANNVPYITVNIKLNIAIIEGAIQNALDSKAQERGYDSLDSAVGRYASPTPTLDPSDVHFAQAEIWRKESNALKVWNSQVWSSAYMQLSSVQSGNTPMPTPEQAVAQLPPFTWPD